MRVGLSWGAHADVLQVPPQPSDKEALGRLLLFESRPSRGSHDLKLKQRNVT